MLIKSKSLSFPRNLTLGTFGKLLIVFSTKVNLLYLFHSTAWRCCLLYLIKQNCLLKSFLRTLRAFSHFVFLRNTPSQTLDRALNMPLDYVSCLAVVPTGIFCKGVPASFLRHTPFDPTCSPFLISLFPLFSFPPPFKVFQTVSPTLMQAPPALIRHTNLTHNV